MLAEQLVDIGTIHDDELSHSPAELAEWVDVTVRGGLTDEVGRTNRRPRTPTTL